MSWTLGITSSPRAVSIGSASGGGEGDAGGRAALSFMKVIALGLDLVEVLAHSRSAGTSWRAVQGAHVQRSRRAGLLRWPGRACDALRRALCRRGSRGQGKALGTGFAEGARWADIEVLRAERRPALRGPASRRGAERVRLGIGQVLVTLTHTKARCSGQRGRPRSAGTVFVLLPGRVPSGHSADQVPTLTLEAVPSFANGAVTGGTSEEDAKDFASPHFQGLRHFGNQDRGGAGAGQRPARGESGRRISLTCGTCLGRWPILAAAA